MVKSLSYQQRGKAFWQEERPLLIALFSLTFLRMGAILTSPLEFGVDEAQYWLWGQQLDFGYYSKPPLIGWFLAAVDGLFGASQQAARIMAPVFHLLIALILYHCARAHYPDETTSKSAGRWAALFWISLPIVSLGSFVISTDTILLLPWAISLFIFLSALRKSQPSLFFITGLIIGIGLLAKYAAAYFILGAVLCLIFDKARNAQQTAKSIILLLAGALISFSPNLLWNLANGGITFAHIGENADLSVPLYSFASAFEFLLSQSAVTGPVFFILFAATLLRPLQTHLRFELMMFCLPVLAIMTIQAYMKTANANWAATAWPAACLLVGMAMAHHLPRRAGQLSLSVNLFASLIVLIGLGIGNLHSLTPKSDPLRRLRGWEVLATDLRQAANSYEAQIIIADRRAEAALLSWHLHDSGLQVKVIDEDGIAGSHFELNHALIENDQRPYIIITDKDTSLPERFAKDAQIIGLSETQISANRSRSKDIYLIR